MRHSQFLVLRLSWRLVLGGAAPSQAQSELIGGQVTKVDESAGKITIKHGPLKKFDMEDGMTMVFRAGRSRNVEKRQGRRSGEVHTGAHQRSVHRDQDRKSEVAGRVEIAML